MTRVLPLIAAAAGLIGAVIEWRRDERRRNEQQQRIDQLEQKVGALVAWHDRMARAS